MAMDEKTSIYTNKDYRVNNLENCKFFGDFGVGFEEEEEEE